MSGRKHENEQWKELLRFAEAAKRREWALSPRLPDPSYDPTAGWSLDQLAMRFESVLLQEYKQVMADLHSPGVSHGWIEVHSALTGKLKEYLLDPCFRVEGVEPGTYGPTLIHRPLLEGMVPVVETSELVERGIRQIYRRFECVRVFQQEQGKGRGGRRPTYDWPSLRDKLDRDIPRFPTLPELVDYCRSNVKPLPGQRPSAEGADDATIRAAISKYGLMKFIRS